MLATHEAWTCRRSAARFEVLVCRRVMAMHAAPVGAHKVQLTVSDSAFRDQLLGKRPYRTRLALQDDDLNTVLVIKRHAGHRSRHVMMCVQQ